MDITSTTDTQSLSVHELALHLGRVAARVLREIVWLRLDQCAQSDQVREEVFGCSPAHRVDAANAVASASFEAAVTFLEESAIDGWAALVRM